MALWSCHSFPFHCFCLCWEVVCQSNCCSYEGNLALFFIGWWSDHFSSFWNFYSDVWMLCSFWIHRAFCICSLMSFITFGEFLTLAPLSLSSLFGLQFTGILDHSLVSHMFIISLQYFISFFSACLILDFFFWPMFQFPKFSPVFCEICFKPPHGVHYFKIEVLQIQNFLFHSFLESSLFADIFNLIFYFFECFKYMIIKACVW